MEVFTPASHREVLGLITQIAVLLFTARAMGEIAQRLGQPAVIGEIMAGILLGPSCLGTMFPFISGFIIPEHGVQGYLLEAISLLGAMFLLLITGLETDIQLIRRHAKTALSVSLAGITVTFSSAFFLAQTFPDHLLVNPQQRLIFGLFFATAMSIASIPVLAKVLMDLKMIRRDIGQTILAAGMSDDTLGWIFLSIIATMATGQALTMQTILGSAGVVLLFIIISFTIGQWIVKRSLDYIQDMAISKDRLLTLVVVFTFIWGSIAQALHIEAVLGAFIMGILFGKMPRLPLAVRHNLESIALGIFAPIFFAVAGLKVNILSLLRPELMFITVAVLFTAMAAKIAGTYVGARFAGHKNQWYALSFGAGLSARGAMGIIIATIGLTLGLLTQEMFSIIVVMSLVTSLLSPFLLKFTLQHIKPSPEELKRLQQEELNQESLIRRIHRVLLPIRADEKQKFSAAHRIKARILQRIGTKTKLSITLLSVGHAKNTAQNLEFLNHVATLFPSQELVKKNIDNPKILDSILDEAQKFYDLLVLGASRPQSGTNYLFSSIIDSLASLSPCSTLIVHAKDIPEQWEPRRILVPTNGSLAAKRAAELAFLLPVSAEETVFILNVLERDKDRSFLDPQSEPVKRQVKVAEKMVEELKKLGQMNNVNTAVKVELGDPESIILDFAKKEQIDLIILGTDVRPASDRLFLGPRVERILLKSHCPVIVLNAI